jgi:hypothetical protein
MRGWGLVSVCLVTCSWAFVGCGSRRPIAATGSERGACNPDGTCNSGLSCFSNRCVKYNSDASDGVPSPDAGGPAGASGNSGVAGTGGASGSGQAGGLGGNGQSGSGGAPVDGGAGPGGGSGQSGSGGSGGGSGNGSSGTGGSQAGGGGSGGDSDTDASTDAPDGRAPYCDGGAIGSAESLLAAACGYTPATTAATYSGFVSLTVSGLYDNSPQSPLEDPFYLVSRSATDQAGAACPDCFRYNRVSEATCVCSTECAAASHRIADLLVGDYPTFRPDHQYSVVLDFGSAPPERLNFGMADCGCNDNSGSHSVVLTQLTRGTCDD